MDATLRAERDVQMAVMDAVLRVQAAVTDAHLGVVQDVRADVEDAQTPVADVPDAHLVVLALALRLVEAIVMPNALRPALAPVLSSVTVQ